jgi:hypothetical protein
MHAFVREASLIVCPVPEKCETVVATNIGDVSIPAELAISV